MKSKKILTLAEDFVLSSEMLRKGYELLLPSMAGMIAFPAVLGVMQNYVWKTTSVTANRRFAAVGGALSLLTAAACSAVSYAFVEQFVCATPKSLFIFVDTNTAATSLTSYGLLCIFTFKLFGGRFRNLCPSHILYPGAYAVKHVQLPTLTSAVTKQRLAKVQRIGEKYGCHTCGKRYNVGDALIKYVRQRVFGYVPHVRVDYFGDHNPPVALAGEYMKKDISATGRLFPQCKKCSYFQASQVRLHLAGKTLTHEGMVTHATRFKLHKMWIPYPILLQYGLIAQLIQQYFTLI